MYTMYSYTDKMLTSCCSWIHVAFIILLQVQITECFDRRPRPVNVRIFGGSVAVKGQFPFQISLKENGDHLCGGSIINEWTVLTAAHCISDLKNPSPENYAVLAGELYNTVTDGEFDVEKIIIHEKYNNETVHNDIAIIQLSEPLNFQNGNGVKPVQLSNPTLNRKAFKSRCVTSGWGAIDNNDSYPDRLLWVKVNLVTNIKCNAKLRRHNMEGFPIPISNICTVNNGHGTCSGDSGGPMGCYVNGVYRLVGVTSWGPPDCNKPPNVFARVSRYVGWIEQHTKTAPTPENTTPTSEDELEEE